MSEAERAEQREQWRRVLAAKNARQRRQHGPRARGMRIVGGQAVSGAGMLRIQPPVRRGYEDQDQED